MTATLFSLGAGTGAKEKKEKIFDSHKPPREREGSNNNLQLDSEEREGHYGNKGE